MDKTKTEEKIDSQLITGKVFEINAESGTKLQCITISKKLLGPADTVLVSQDGVTYIAHDAKEFMRAIDNSLPIRTR